jgi:hypothetical protein
MREALALQIKVVNPIDALPSIRNMTPKKGTKSCRSCKQRMRKMRKKILRRGHKLLLKLGQGPNNKKFRW